MKAVDFTTTIKVRQSAAEAFRAINNVRGWWQGEIHGDTAALGAEFTYQMRDIHFSRQEIVTWVPDEKVEWHVTESRLSFTADPNEWKGNRIVFEIADAWGQTQIKFTHIGLSAGSECFNRCSNAWRQLIQHSLYRLITEGEGTAVFD